MPTVADAMIAHPRLSAPHDTVDDVRVLLADEHVHAALVVDDDGTLITVVERADLTAADGAALAAGHGTLIDRVATADHDLGQAHRELTCSGRRRLAVVDEQHRLLGLLCLRASGVGFCTERDVLRSGA